MNTTRTENLFLQIHHQWIFLFQVTFERLIYRIAGDDAEANKKMMEELSKDGKYSITPEMKAKLADFYGNYASEEETAAIIKKIYEETGYVMDTIQQLQHLYMKNTRKKQRMTM